MSTSNDNKQGDERRTVIEDGTKMKGALSSQHPIVVMGLVEGELSGPRIEIAESGVVAGRLKATELRSRGEIAGEVDADEMHLAGRVRDRTVLRAKVLEIRSEPGAPAAVTFGDCEIAVGEMPDKAAAIAAITAAQKARRGAEPPAVEAPPAPETPAAEEPAAAAAVPEAIAPEKTDVNKARKPHRERPAQAS
jgi:cytoskeletal protein CcmA (bactofilin family)